MIDGAEGKKLIKYQHDTPNGYVRLDQRCYDDAKNRTYAQILGKDAEKHKVVVRSEYGITDLVPEEKARELLKAKGVKARPERVDRGSREREKKAKLETSIRMAILKAIHTKHSGTLSCS